MSKKFFKKIFKKRRSDVSFLIYGKILVSLIFGKIIYIIQNKKIKNNSCLIIFPPSLGLGDLIMLSKIINIIKSYDKYDSIKVAHLAPYVHKNRDLVSFISLYKWKDIFCYETFIFPTPSLLNYVISIFLGREKCKGYINNNYVNFKVRNPYQIKFDDPYHFRLKPFKAFYKFKESTIPEIWNKFDRENLKMQTNFLSISNYHDLSYGKYSGFIVLSTYNFYEKFRPSLSSILNEINKIKKNYKSLYLIILGAKRKRELIYNQELESFLEINFKESKIINLTGKLSLQNSLDIISQSSYYIGANNGLANIAQMLGIRCTLIFTGPEKPKKRRFSKFSKFLYLN